MVYPSPQQTNPLSPVPGPYSIFDGKQKAFIVCIVSIAATFSGFASNIYFPALPTIAEDLSVSIELVNLTVTTYLVFQGIAPSLWGPISDARGRRIAYIGTFIVFFGACIGLAESESYTALMLLRCLQSTGSASTIAIGSGVIGDITTRDDRGGLMGVFQAGLLVPVALGPVIGGAMADAFGWRAVFWFLAIYSGIFLLILVLLLPETLRCIVGNGGRTPSSFISKYPLTTYQSVTTIKWNSEQDSGPPPYSSIDVTGPFRILFSKLAAPIITFLAIYYTVWQMSITAMSTLFKTHYNLSETHIGLTFIANGAGSIIGTLTTGKFLDIDYHRFKSRYLKSSHPGAADGDRDMKNLEEGDCGFPLEQARLRLVPIFCLVQCLSVTVFGWTVEYSDHVHIAVPIVATFMTGWTAVSTQSVVMTYLIDVFSDQSAAASASLNLARCLLAAGGTSVIKPMVNGLGIGWSFSLCVLVQVLGLSCVLIQWKFGNKWRQEMIAEKTGTATE